MKTFQDYLKDRNLQDDWEGYRKQSDETALQIGLVNPQILTGPEIDTMDDAELRESIRQANVYARVVPEQKLRLVQALKTNGEIVAMTGDGVNDAPALKSAHIGIAMGGRGTDVAREASDLVLLDDDFSSIVQAVRQGRRIFDNLRKTMAYIFAIHVPIAGISLVPLMMGWPLILYPVHVAFLELIIDPACSLVFEAEPEEGHLMSRAPRNSGEALFGERVIGLGLGQGFALLVSVVAVFAGAYYSGHTESSARALTFGTLIVGNLGLIMANRSWSQTILRTIAIPNAALWWVVAGAIGFMGMVLYVPYFTEIFHFSRLGLTDIIICFAAGVLSIAWFELAKLLSPNGVRGPEG